MSSTGTPARRRRPHLEALLRGAPAHVPGFAPTPGGPGHALLDAAAALLERLDGARPVAIRRQEEALLGTLGVAELTAQPARAPLTVEPVQGARTRLPAGARVEGTTSAGSVQFETDAEIEVADAELAAVVAHDPASDTISDHSATAAAGVSFTLFEPAVPVPHELLIGHGTLLDLAGSATIEVDLGVVPANRGRAVALTWEWWDGGAWRPFAQRGPTPGTTPPSYQGYPVDGTADLTRSGRILLYSPCAAIKDGTFGGATNKWIRARFNESLSSFEDRDLPRLNDVHLRSFAGRTLPPAAALTDGRRHDTTRAFLPLGATPSAGAAFYVAAPDAFDRAGAHVDIDLRVGESLLAGADKDAEQFKTDLKVAQSLYAAAMTSIKAAQDALATPKVVAALDPAPGSSTESLIDTMQTGIQQAHEAIRTAIPLISVRPGVFWSVDAKAINLGLSELAGALAETSSTPVLFSSARQALLAAFLDPAKTDAARKTLEDAILATTGAPTRFEAPLSSIESRTKDVRAAVVAVNGHLTAGLAALETLTNSGAVAVLRDQMKAPDPKLPPPQIEWEYWNGSKWTPVPNQRGGFDFTIPGKGTLSFDVPTDWASSTEAGQEHRWLRARLVSGGYGHLRLVKWTDQKSTEVNVIPVVDHRPPVVDHLEISYTWTSQSERPEHCLSFNDYNWKEHQDTLGTPGWSFAPFMRAAFGAPSLFLGFDGPLPSGWVGMWLGVGDDATSRTGGDLSVTTWDGTRWRPAAVSDETLSLSEPGIVRALLGGSAARALFDRELHWMRLSFDKGMPAPRVPMVDIAPNAVWVSQSATHREEVLGSSDGTPGQTLFLRYTPVAAGEEIWVLEASGGLARVKAPAILEEHGVGPTDHHPDVDVRHDLAGHPVAVWVRWHGRLTFAFSGSGDRHYVIDRGRGRLVFGDGTSGMVPPPDQDSVVARIYESVDGRLGNVPTGAITRVISNVGASTARNLRPATGGADQEGLASAIRRGRHLARHRRQALSLADYEALALDASPEVASARAVGPVDAAGRPAPGPVRVMVVPRGLGDTPALSDVLRRRITDHLVARIPAAAPLPWVVGPRYLQLGVEASVTAAPPAGAGDVRDRVETEIRRFLHPADGGSTGGGWGFGQPVSISDIASVLEALPGVDALVGLRWTIDRTPVPDRVEPDADRVIAPGPVSVRASGGEVRP